MRVCARQRRVCIWCGTQAAPLFGICSYWCEGVFSRDDLTVDLGAFTLVPVLEREDCRMTCRLTLFHS